MGSRESREQPSPGYHKGPPISVSHLLNITHGFLFAQVQAPPVIPATPAPTAVTEVASGETADVVQAAAEQSFTELGLGSYTPVGMIQNLLEFIHVNLGLPWWGAIAVCKRTASWKRDPGGNGELGIEL